MGEPELRVATICTGNICRSPMAEVILKHLIAEDPELNRHVLVTSAGTASWHVGRRDGPPCPARPRSRWLPPGRHARRLRDTGVPQRSGFRHGHDT